MFDEVEFLRLLNETDLKELSENREAFEAPLHHYKIQPENQRKLVWLSGPPGVGKSTTAQLLSKHAGFVYYEADCTGSFLNPFIPANEENPTAASFKQKPMKVSMQSEMKFSCYIKCLILLFLREFQEILLLLYLMPRRSMKKSMDANQMNLK
jgi:hypothetical protein